MDLLKEEERLIKNLVKAREDAERKEKHLVKSQGSFMIAQREVKAASVRVRKIKKQIKAQGVEHLFVPDSLDYPDEKSEPVVIHTPSVKPTPTEEENTD